MSDNKNSLILLHILGCTAFLILSLLLSPHPPHDHILDFSPPTRRDFIANGLMLVFFYLNYYLLIPRLYFNKRYFIYFVCLLAGFLFICLLPTLLTNSAALPRPGVSDNFPKPPPTYEPGATAAASFLSVISHHIFLFFAVTLFSLLLKIRTRLFKAEAARNNAELSYLRAQINPHFLFNTLNSIYSLAIVKDDKTADAVIQLSELMRYISRDAESEFVALEKEIGYINNYIALQKTRFGETVVINYRVEGELAGKQIAPLILITYIENAFKHGINPDQTSEISIKIAVEENDLHLVVNNRKVSSLKEEEGVGIHNTAERLKLLYPSKHELKIYDKEDSYTADLLIKLT